MCCRMQTTSCPALPHSRRGVCSSDRVARTRFFRPNYGAVQVQPLSSPACPPRGSFPRPPDHRGAGSRCLLATRSDPASHRTPMPMRMDNTVQCLFDRVWRPGTSDPTNRLCSCTVRLHRVACPDRFHCLCLCVRVGLGQ